MRTPHVLRVAGLTGLGGVAASAALVLTAASATAGGSDDAAGDTKTTVTIWRAPASLAAYQYQYGAYGGYTYGTQPGDAAFVSHRRSVDVSADGELRFPGVSTKIDPSTVQFRSLTDAKGTSVVEQRFAYDLGSPEHLLHRYLGESVTVTTSRGDIEGILRGIDSDSLMLETGSGKTRAVELIRRGDNLLDVKLASGDDTLATVPTLVWKVLSKKAGKQDVEVSYRTEGLRWDADYTAILDDKDDTVDLSAWATVTNDTGVEYKNANLELVTGILDNVQPQPQYAGAYVPRAPSDKPQSFTVPRPVTITPGGTVQVELVPAKSSVGSKRVVMFETTADMSASYQSYMYTDCYSYNQPTNGSHGELDLEVAAPTKGAVLPEGAVRIFKRKGDGLELLGEDTLHVNGETGYARLRLGNDETITGSRKQLECKYNDATRSLREKFEIEVENNGKEPTEVVLKEYMYRWISWKMDGEDIPGTKAAAQTQEYRVKLGANSKKTFTYAVVYSW